MRQTEPVAGIEPEVESAIGFLFVGGSHEMEKGFFEGIGLRELVREAQDNVQSQLILFGELFPVSQKQSAGAFEVFALFGRERFLNLPADVVHGFCTEADDMKPVDNDLCIGKKRTGNVEKALVHIHYDIFDLASVVKGPQVILNRFDSAGRKDIENTMVQRIRDDALKPFTSQIPLEFIK